MNAIAALAGLGTALPSRRVTNEELSRSLDTDDEWIQSRTGIKQRFWSAGETTSDLAVEAGRNALSSAAMDTVDLLIVATTTPDHPCPATAPDVTSRLGLGTVAAYDIAAVCSGFVYGLASAAAHIAAGLAGSVLVIGAETYSTILDPDDRTTSVIFGDGAGAAVLRATAPGSPGCLLGFDLGSDGSLKDLITIPDGGSRQRTSRSGPTGTYFTMQGRPVFRHAVDRMTESAGAVLDKTGWSVESVDWFVGHQANARILRAVADGLGVKSDRVIIDLDRVGNTSAASIPLALARAATEGNLVPGDRVLLSAFGGGATWGSTVLVWPDISAL
ncbi:beta-ketoacyl-ACP synthase III [Streptomyces sp. NPDC102282]|uniref:beta-ketoacyl-ACP synthase III n=1 Tax=Streptomyces sp. NPDC102282 TaxID=3366154 RepID=UPI003817BD65